MLNLVFTETSLELVPKEIQHHPSVRRNAKRRKKPPAETLLDRSLHHYAMNNLLKSEKRGRPDIIHFCLLLTMGSPLNMKGKLRLSINTINGLNIEVDPATHPPRDCIRFYGLMEQLLVNGSVPVNGESLMWLSRTTLRDQLEREEPSRIIALTSQGEKSSFPDVAAKLSDEVAPTLFIGAYPKGPMSPDLIELADDVYSVYPESLEAWTVTSRIIYEYEKLIFL
jgi:rRNA small subunit pseudouridine methyltransferase Nep1